MEELYDAAVSAAKSAGKFVQKQVSQFKQVDHKGRADLVTNIDRDSESMIVKHISERFPEHAIIAEENDYEKRDHDYRWVIDPLDGTTNYVHGYRHYAVSIALHIKREPAIGVVFDPANNELFTAIRGRGAFLNDQKIQVSETSQLLNCMLVTGIPYDLDERWHRSFDLFKAFYYRTQGVRRDGSAALDMCYVASGRFDGFWEYNLHPWDVAAAMLIVQEAGGQVSDFRNGKSSIFDAEVLATNGKIHQKMLEVIQEFPGFSDKEE